jgi:hypothetical protein
MDLSKELSHFNPKFEETFSIIKLPGNDILAFRDDTPVRYMAEGVSVINLLGHSKGNMKNQQIYSEGRWYSFEHVRTREYVVSVPVSSHDEFCKVVEDLNGIIIKNYEG